MQTPHSKNKELGITKKIPEQDSISSYTQQDLADLFALCLFCLRIKKKRLYFSMKLIICNITTIVYSNYERVILFNH